MVTRLLVRMRVAEPLTAATRPSTRSVRVGHSEEYRCYQRASELIVQDILFGGEDGGKAVEVDGEGCPQARKERQIVDHLIMCVLKKASCCCLPKMGVLQLPYLI